MEIATPEFQQKGKNNRGGINQVVMKHFFRTLKLWPLGCLTLLFSISLSICFADGFADEGKAGSSEFVIHNLKDLFSLLLQSDRDLRRQQFEQQKIANPTPCTPIPDPATEMTVSAAEATHQAVLDSLEARDVLTSLAHTLDAPSSSMNSTSGGSSTVHLVAQDESLVPFQKTMRQVLGAQASGHFEDDFQTIANNFFLVRQFVTALEQNLTPDQRQRVSDQLVSVKSIIDSHRKLIAWANQYQAPDVLAPDFFQIAGFFRIFFANQASPIDWPCFNTIFGTDFRAPMDLKAFPNLFSQFSWDHLFWGLYLKMD